MDTVTNRLRTLFYQGQNLIDSGLVSGVFTDGTSIRITLEKPPHADLEDLKQQIQNTLADLERDVHISVNTEDKEVSLRFVKGKYEQYGNSTGYYP